MPLKYKKLVVLFSLGIMFIGLGTFSLLSPDFSFDFLKNAEGKNTESESSTFGAIQAVHGKSQEQVQQEIEELVKTYFDAKLRVDMEDIASCVSDVSHVDEKKLLVDATYVESYQNIQCLILDGAEKGSYRVYVYYDVKIYDIDTLVPSLNALYVKENNKNAFEIYLGSLETEEQKRINELDESPRVKGLVETVQKQLADVVSSDSEVREFYEMLEGRQEQDDTAEE